MYLKLKLHCFSHTPYKQQREGLEWPVRCFVRKASDNNRLWLLQGVEAVGSPAW